MTITYWPGLCWGLGGPGGAVVAGQPGLGGPQCGPHYCSVTSNTLNHYSMIIKKTKLSAQYFPNIVLFVISSVMCLIGPMVVHWFKARPVIPKTVRHNPPLD